MIPLVCEQCRRVVGSTTDNAKATILTEINGVHVILIASNLAPTHDCAPVRPKLDTSPDTLRVLADELDMAPPGGARYAGRVLRQLADERDEWRHEMLRLLAELAYLVDGEEERAMTRATTPEWVYFEKLPEALLELGMKDAPGWLLKTTTGRAYVFGDKYGDANKPARAAFAFGMSHWMRARRTLEMVDHSAGAPIDRDVTTGPTETAPRLEVLEGGATDEETPE